MCIQTHFTGNKNIKLNTHWKKLINLEIRRVEFGPRYIFMYLNNLILSSCKLKRNKSIIIIMKDQIGKITIVTLTLPSIQANSGKNWRTYFVWIRRRIQKLAAQTVVNTNFNRLKIRCQVQATQSGSACSKLRHIPTGKIIPFLLDNHLKNGRSQGVYLDPLIEDYLKLTFIWLNLDKTKLKATSQYLLKCCFNQELKLGSDLKGNKLHVCKHIGTKIKMKKNLGLLLTGTEAVVTKDMKQAEALNKFFGSVFIAKLCSQASWVPESWSRCTWLEDWIST